MSREDRVSKLIHLLETNNKSSKPSRERSIPNKEEPMRRRNPRMIWLKRSRRFKSKLRWTVERHRLPSKKLRKPTLRPLPLARRPKVLEPPMPWRLLSKWRQLPSLSKRLLSMMRLQ